MKIRIAIEQVIDTDNYDFYDDLSDENRVVYLIERFADDIDTLVKFDEVMDNISVEYLED